MTAVYLVCAMGSFASSSGFDRKLKSAAICLLFVSTCQAISVSTIREQSYDTVSFYPPTSPTLPPQLAYYVARGVNMGSDYNAPATILNNVQSHMTNTKPKKVNHPVEAQSTRIIVRDMSPLSEILNNLQQTPVMIHRYSSSTPKVLTNNAYQQRLPRSQRFGFIPNYRPSIRQFAMNDLVRATGPPPGPNDPPPPKMKRLFMPTFQINQLQRNYRQQQMIDQQTPKRVPKIQNMVMIEVKPPHLGPESNVYSSRINPLVPQINYLRDQQRHHFGIDQDEHPAQRPNPNHISPLDPDYNVYSNGFRLFNDQVEEHNHIRNEYPSNDHAEPIKNYEQLHNEFLQSSSFKNDDDRYGSLRHHTDPFEKNYQNFVDDTAENYDKRDTSGNNYQYQSPINGEYQKYLAETPNFVKPVDYANYVDRSGSTTSAQPTIDGGFVPYQMLASVRHRERVIHKSKEDAEEPTVKERIQEEGGHVVYTEQGYEDNQYDHGDEERFAAFKKSPEETRQHQHRRKRSAHRTLREFPYYFINPVRLPELSALRYAETQGRRARGAENFYDTKPLDCEHIEFDDSAVNDKETEIIKKRRLKGLGDKIGCYKQKYFGADPFSNPIFKEQLVSDQASFRFKRSLVDDTKFYIPSSSNKNDTMPPHLNSSTTASLFHRDTENKLPTVILLSDKSLAKIKANPSMPIADILKYPEVQNSEVFIFDISKFIPRLFINDHLKDFQTTNHSSESRNRRKTIRKTKRPSHHNHNTNSN